MSDVSVKRKMLAVVCGLLAFYVLDIGMDRLAVIYVPQTGVSLDIALARLGIRLPIPALFTITKLLSAFLAGAAGALVLREKDFILLSLPVLMLEMPFFYIAFGEKSWPLVVELLLASTVPAVACCMLGIWTAAKLRRYPIG